MFIPNINQDAKVRFSCNDGAKDLKYCPTNGEELDECDVQKLTNNNDNSTLSCDVSIINSILNNCC